MKVDNRALATLGALTAAMVLGIAPNANACHDLYTGTLTTNAVPCDTFCTAGPLTGGLAGGLEWTMDTMVETGIPNVVMYTGVNTVTTNDGTLVGSDVCYWNVVTGEFVDHTEWSSGTGEYAGATGALTIIGTFDPATGAGASHYFAQVRTP